MTGQRRSQCRERPRCGVGCTAHRAKLALAAGPQGQRAQIVKSSDGTQLLQVDEPFDRAWALPGGSGPFEVWHWEYTRGVVAMAKAGSEAPGTSGSQFFVVTADDAGLPPDYAVAGKVTKGDVLAAPIQAILVEENLTTDAVTRDVFVNRDRGEKGLC